MSGNLRLAQPENFDQIADAHFAARNEIQQAQSRSVGKGRK
jgi:hypothetical protein